VRASSIAAIRETALSSSALHRLITCLEDPSIKRGSTEDLGFLA